ncbi:MAG: hypothetical protein V8T29_11700 [Oscillospiraceae bacterium]
MKQDQNAARIGIYIDKQLLSRCDAAIPAANARSRSELISDALELYLAWLHNKDASKVLTPALESVIAGKIGDTENRLARVLFKQGVELAMLMHVVAAANDIREQDLDALRKLCVDEVSRLGGKYKFDDAVRFQKG